MKKIKCVIVSFLVLCGALSAADKSIVLVAGKDSHGYGDHEFRAGCHLLADRLNKSGLPLKATVVEEGNWPSSNEIFEKADTIVIYSDGSGSHPLESKKLFSFMDGLIKKGKNIGFMHYACEVKDDKGPTMLKWVGGYYKNGYSTNPHWKCSSILNKEHPAANGVSNFKLKDEWYFNIKLGKDIVAVLQGVPDDEARSGKTSWPRGPKKHIQADTGKTETLLWTLDRADGGRGFGFTGGHIHVNWKNDEYRKLILNTIVWTSGLKIPAQGIESATPTDKEMKANMKPIKKPKKKKAKK
jgi:hypothetical protein